MRKWIAAALMVIALPAAAQISEGVDQPSADEMRRELFGVHLFGETGYGQPWNECIEPDGDTLYVIGERESRGKAWVPRDGEICFNYGGPDFCFQTYRYGDEYVFRGGGSRWRTTKIRENVEFCILSDMIG